MLGKILVCDDQELVREVVCGFLERKGYDVTKANDGEECLALIKNGDFDAVFLDIKMPKMDGITVLRELERLQTKIQVILMSGFDPIDLPSGAGSPTRVEFLSKPFSLESIIQALKVKEKSGTKRVLIVDDQDMLREMLKEYLEPKGYEIMEARNGLECIDLVSKNEFAAVFMDVRMPEMDGLQALDKLRKQGIKTPVFIMSGYGEVSSVEDALNRGAQNFLPKPFRLEKALEMLNPVES